MGEGEVRFRLIHDGVPVTNPDGDAFVFGLQDIQQHVHPGAPSPHSKLAFDFTLRAKADAKTGAPVFLGPFASGPADNRHVYLSWRSIPRGVWINRLKIRLADVDWPMILAAQAGTLIEADVTGWRLGEPKQKPVWRLL